MATATFDGQSEWGDSFVRMSTAGVVKDFFAPFNNACSRFRRTTTSAPVAPSCSRTSLERIRTRCSNRGKDGTIYLVDRDNMGQVQLVDEQHRPDAPEHLPADRLVRLEPGNFSSPVYLGGYVFFSPNGDNTQGFRLTNGLLSTTPALRSTAVFPDRGAQLAASSSGGANGVLWVASATSSSPGVLYAYDPRAPLNGIAQGALRQRSVGLAGHARRHREVHMPLVANGKVFVAGETRLTTFGLLP